MTYGKKKFTDIDVKYPNGRKDVGTYTINASLKGNYSGSGRATFAVYKADSPMAVSTRTVKFKREENRSKLQPVASRNAIIVRDSIGTPSYTRLTGPDGITIDSKTGEININKKLKKGTYTMTVNVLDPGDRNHTMKTRVVMLKVKVI